MDCIDLIKSRIRSSIEVKEQILESLETLDRIRLAAEFCTETIRQGGKIVLAGNGGSAADSQHIAAEFVSRFEFERSSLSALALTTDTSMLTAIGNDYGFSKVFERQLLANGRKGDVFIGISTSGASENVKLALCAARRIGMTSVALTGDNNKLDDLADIVVKAPANKTALIQESHIMIGHAICAIVEKNIFTNN